MDTRTPSRTSGGRSQARSQAIEEAGISTVRVPSDPAQVAVNHASFRVKLAQPPQVSRYPSVPSSPASQGLALGVSAFEDTSPLPLIPPAPEPPGATQLLQAVQAGGTRLIPRAGRAYNTGATDTADVDELSQARASVIGPRSPEGGDLPGAPFPAGDDEDEADGDGARGARPVRHAWHPNRRWRNSGAVLLPLRAFLGGISVYAGMSKLCDPVFFDGGERGSIVTWLSSLHPWTVAEPLRDFALNHPVGAGLTVAFIQIVVGVLTVLGLWQRFAAAVGIVVSAALLVTVSWRSVPAYDAPDIVYLAAWSPLLIAGAPSLSLDGRLAKEAWRRLGPRVSVYELRRWVLRRGAVVATVVSGLALLIGSVLGGAVRAGSTTEVPDPSSPPTNHLPGEPLPSQSPSAGADRPSSEPSATPSAEPSRTEHSTPPAAVQPTADEGGAVGGAGVQPTQGGGAGVTQPQQPQPSPPPQQTAQPEPTPSRGGALGGILGAGPGGLLGMSPQQPAGSSASA